MSECLWECLAVNLRKVLAVTAVSIFLVLPAGVSAAEQGEFHYEASLSDGHSSLRSAVLPWTVLSHLLQENQADLQVVNAAGQAVPSLVRPVASVTQNREEIRSLDFFSGDDPERLGTLLTLQDGGAAKLTELNQPGRHYLIVHNSPQTPDNELPLQALALDWLDLPHWLPKSLLLESSDDLLRWTPVGIAGLPYVLTEKSTTLENKILKFSEPVKARFIRLSGTDDFAPLLPTLLQVSGQFGESSTKNTLNWQAVGLQAGENLQTFDYEVPPSVPVSQWRLALTQPGSVYAGTLYTRSGKGGRYGEQAGEWQYQHDFRDYLLTTDAGELRADAGTVSAGTSREWRFDFSQPAPMLVTDAPRLELGWQPLEVRFVAQGAGPFRLRYGSRANTLEPVSAFDANLAATKAEAVTVGEEVQLSALEPEFTVPKLWLRLLLWGVLGSAVVALLWMARRLLREVGKPGQVAEDGEVGHKGQE